MDKETNLQDIKDYSKKYCDDRDWDQFHNPKEKLVLKEKGLIRKGYRQGNIVVDFQIKMPHSISKSEADLLKNL
jgi:DnaJ-class molecular chaperone